LRRRRRARLPPRAFDILLIVVLLAWEVAATTITNPPRWSRSRAAIDVQVLTALLVGEFARHERAGPGIMKLDPDLQLLREVRNGVAHLGLEAERADDLLVPFPPGVRSSSWPSSTSRIWAYFGNKDAVGRGGE
jgi:hypothetical protein